MSMNHDYETGVAQKVEVNFEFYIADRKATTRI